MMKKAFFLFVTGCLLVGSSFAQQLTCNASAVQGQFGLWPLAFDTAYVNKPYAQIITFKAPADAKQIPGVEDAINLALDAAGITIPPGANLHLLINSYQIKALNGLPTGFSHTCSETDCKYNGGDVGCAKIEGKATQGSEGNYNVSVELYAKIEIKVMAGPFPVYTNMRDTTLTLPTTYQLVVRPESEAPETPLAINDIASHVSVLYPNPTNSFVWVEQASEYASYEIYNTNGQLLKKNNFVSDMDKISVYDLDDGLYFVRLLNKNGQSNGITHKLTVKK